MIGLICYHKNITKIYPKEWIEKFKHSIVNQTYNNYRIYEMNYGGGEERIFENSTYESKTLPTFVHAMQELITKALKDGCSAIGNTNVDDYYSNDRLERQNRLLIRGFDLVSSNFTLVEDDKEVHSHRFHQLNIRHELMRGHNIIAHPVVCYSRKFFDVVSYKPEEVPREDLLLWRRAINNDLKIVILPDHLLFHRLHKNSVCQSENR